MLVECGAALHRILTLFGLPFSRSVRDHLEISVSSGILSVVSLDLELVLLHIILHVVIYVRTSRILPPRTSDVACVTWCGITVALK